MSSAELVASYFGRPEKRLFGCFNTPRSAGSRPVAVVICQPIGHEYVNSHRALRQLALRLGGIGFPVLRFDYFGCGDSEGDAEEGRLAEWIENLSEAISEISRRTNASHLCLIGLRLGASLALLTAAGRNDIQSLVLWDPIVNGRKYVSELISLNREQLRFRPKPKKGRRTEWPKDIIGFPITSELNNEINGIDLLTIRKKPADNVLIVDGENHPDGPDLKRVLESLRASVVLQHIEAPLTWVPTVDGGLQVPFNVLQSITSWMDRAYR